VDYLANLMSNRGAAFDEEFDLDIRLELPNIASSSDPLKAVFQTNTCNACQQCACISQNCGTITCFQTFYFVPTRISYHPQTPVPPHHGDSLQRAEANLS
jgi:hypothetical protein